jgi:homoserine acetyltransferase
MASLPTPMSGRNWMLRRLLVTSIKADPAWNNGNYTAQPTSLQLASVFFATATNGGNFSYMKAGPDRQKADALRGRVRALRDQIRRLEADEYRDRSAEIAEERRKMARAQVAVADFLKVPVLSLYPHHDASLVQEASRG